MTSRLQFNNSSSSNEAKNPHRGTDTCKPKQPHWESEHACVWAWNPTKLQHYLETVDQKVMFVMQNQMLPFCCVQPCLPCRLCPLSLTKSSPIPLSCRTGSWPAIWWNSASKAQSWTGRNLRRRKRLPWLRRLRGPTKAPAGTSHCELNQLRLALQFTFAQKPLVIPDEHIPITHGWCHLQTAASDVGALVSGFQTSTHLTYFFSAVSHHISVILLHLS